MEYKGSIMSFSQNLAMGEIDDHGIRYVLMRPDVLMGIGKYAEGIPWETFLRALETSVTRHVAASFAQYQADGRFSGSEYLEACCTIAASLGWGMWSVSATEAGQIILEVQNSPFAAASGPSSGTVCAPISGVLRAISIAQQWVTEVEEFCCVSRGDPICRFRIAHKA